MNSSDPPPPYETSQADAVVNVQVMPSVATTAIPKAFKGNWKGLTVTGYMQVTLGLVSVLFGLIAIVYKSFLFFIADAIWAGILFFITSGLLGIAAGRRKKNTLVGLYLTMSIISSLFACVIVILHGIALAFEHICPDDRFGRRSSYYYRYGQCSSSYETRTAINSLILVTAFVEMIVAIVGSSLTCCVLCQPSPPSVVTYHRPQQMILARQPQGVVQYTMPQQFGNAVYPVQVRQVPAGSVQYPTQMQYQIQPQALGQFQQGPHLQGQFLQGMYAQGQLQQGPVAQGPQAQGAQAQGAQAQGPQAQGQQGYQVQGVQAHGPQVQGQGMQTQNKA